MIGSKNMRKYHNKSVPCGRLLMSRRHGSGNGWGSWIGLGRGVA